MQLQLSKQIGVGLRQAHYQAVIERSPAVGWFEVHSENYFNPGGPNHYFLSRVREDYPLALHGVGLSIGSADPVNLTYLQKLAALIDRYEPFLVSDHLSWSSFQGEYFPDLYPLPFNQPVIQHLVDRIQQVQDVLRRPLILENVSSYVTFTGSDMTEWDFINQVTRRAGCRLLLDVNNVMVNSCNHCFDPYQFINEIDAESVAEIHLSGATRQRVDDLPFIIDTHDAEVDHDVWGLYRRAIERFGAVPSLVEWDSKIPDLDVLVNQANMAAEVFEDAVYAG